MINNPLPPTGATRVRILLVNFHSTQNSGDLALLEVAIGQLRSAFAGPDLLISANYPDEQYFKDYGHDVVASPAAIVYKSRSGLLQIIRLLVLFLLGWLESKVSILGRYSILPPAWLTMLEAYKAADLIVGCPGNQFFTMGRFGWPLLVSGLSVQFAHFFGKPFYVMPQSLGPLKRTWERRWMRHLYGRARLVYLRDSRSLALAKEIGLPGSRLRLAPDLAITWEPDWKSKNLSILEKLGQSPGSSKLGVTVIRRMVKSLDHNQIERYYQALAAALDHMVRNFDLEIFFFPQVTGPTDAEDDREAAAQVATSMNAQRTKIHLIEDLLQPGDLKSLYQGMDIFVASRLHSGIFALSAGIPTLFIGYLTKTRGVLEDLGIEEWIVDLDQVSAERLSGMIEELWKRREQVRSELEMRIPAYAEKSAQVANQISQDYFHDNQG